MLLMLLFAAATYTYTLFHAISHDDAIYYIALFGSEYTVL